MQWPAALAADTVADAAPTLAVPVDVAVVQLHPDRAIRDVTRSPASVASADRS